MKDESKIVKWTTWCGSISRVECDRESPLCVWVNGVRRAKSGPCTTHYHDTWEEAHAYLTRRAEARVSSARYELQMANSHAGNVKGLRKPKDTDART